MNLNDQDLMRILEWYRSYREDTGSSIADAEVEMKIHQHLKKQEELLKRG